MRSWPIFTLKLFGALHVAMSLLGISGDVWKYVEHAPWALASNPAYPFALQFYCIYVSVDLLCFIFLICAGIALWRHDPRARWLSNAVLAFEVFWFLADSLSSSLLLMWGGYAERVGTSMMKGATIGLASQTLTGYPLIALVAINAAYRKLPQVSSTSGPLREKRDIGGKSWARTVLRVFGVVDIAVGLWGLSFAAFQYVIVVTEKMGMDAAHPYVLPIYRTETAVGALSFLLLIPTGVALWRLKQRGVRLSRGLLGALVVFLVIEQGLRLLLSTRGGEAKALADSIGNSLGSSLFIAPLLVYNAVAVLVIALAFRGMGAAGSQNVPVACQ